MLTTLCYIEKDDKYLMLHRVKKENDLNKDKWVGVGGKFEPGETVSVTVYRGGAKVHLEITLNDKPQQTQEQVVPETQEQPQEQTQIPGFGGFDDWFGSFFPGFGG